MSVSGRLNSIMSRKVYQRIIELVLSAAELARSVGIQNLLQPGLVKEMIIADILEHDLITSKRAADACDPNDPSIVYEYLSCKEGGSGQLDRMFKEPLSKREESLLGIRPGSKLSMSLIRLWWREKQTASWIEVAMRSRM